MSSVIVPSSARRIAPNSRGYMSRDASKIIRKVLRAIAVTRFIWRSSLPGELFLDASVEIVPEPDELGATLRRGQDDIFRPFQGRLVLPVHHEETFFCFSQADVDLSRGGARGRPRGRLERCECRHDAPLPARSHGVRRARPG